MNFPIKPICNSRFYKKKHSIIANEKEELYQKLWQQNFTSFNIAARKKLKLTYSRCRKGIGSSCRRSNRVGRANQRGKNIAVIVGEKEELTCNQMSE